MPATWSTTFGILMHFSAVSYVFKNDGRSKLCVGSRLFSFWCALSPCAVQDAYMFILKDDKACLQCTKVEIYSFCTAKAPCPLGRCHVGSGANIILEKFVFIMFYVRPKICRAQICYLKVLQNLLQSLFSCSLIFSLFLSSSFH